MSFRVEKVSVETLSWEAEGGNELVIEHTNDRQRCPVAPDKLAATSYESNRATNII